MTTRATHSELPPFESLVQRHGHGLLRFCVARLGADRGEDAFQETLLAALRAYPDLRDPAAAGGWLFAIADRKVIDAARESAKVGPATDGDAIEDAAWHDSAADGTLWAAVAVLPRKQRAAVALRYVADLSHGEIATAMGTSEAAARRNVHEGLKQLRGSVER